MPDPRTPRTTLAGPAAGWSWLAAAPPPARPGSPDDGDSLALACARCFDSADGRRVLGHLRTLTLDRALGPEATRSTLLQLEGQRRLVLMLLALIARAHGSPRI